MGATKTIVLVLRSGGDFSFRDVELIARHIHGKWQSEERPRIICLWDKASIEYDLGNIKFIPLTNEYPGTWSRIQLYSPEMEQYRPFLYIDLDTAVIGSLERIFDLVKDESQFIVLEDFWQKGQIATGLVWFPAKSEKISKVWKEFKGATGTRMDAYLRKVVTPDKYWQHLTQTIYDFKPKDGKLLSQVPTNADIVCFHGKPRIFTVAEGSLTIGWVKAYVNQTTFKPVTKEIMVTVIIPYKKDRGWLQEAVNSIPDGVQILLSQGEGNWPQNFNKALPLAKGKYIRWLHEDDMLTPNSINDAVRAIEEQGVDFIHGDAIEIWVGSNKTKNWKPLVKNPTLKDLIYRNTIHSTSLLYKREVFETIGGLDERTNVYSFEEYEFNMRCLAAGLKLGYCPHPLAIYRRHPEQIIRNVSKGGKMREREIVRSKFREYVK
jgi:hypothetical protein